MEGRGFCDVIENNGFEVHSFLGRGGFAECFKVFSKQYQQYFACKVIPISGPKKESRQKSFENEISVLINIIHHNVIQVYKAFMSETHLFLILEFCSNGDLQKQVSMHGPIKNQVLLLNYISQILDALNYMESIGIAHKDIKPSNIFIDNHGRTKLADFGLAGFVDESNISYDYGGSLAFSSPEVLMMKPHNPYKADIWSLGVSIFYLATGKYPFPHCGRKNILRLILAEMYTIPVDMDDFIKNLIKICLQTNPDKRMSFAELKDMVDDEIGKRMACRRPTSRINGLRSVDSCIIIPKIRQSKKKSLTPTPVHSSRLVSYKTSNNNVETMSNLCKFL